MLTEEEANVSVNLKRLVDLRGVSLREFAAMSGVPFQTVHTVLAGTRSPRIGIVAKLARALGVSVDELLATPEPTKPKRRVAS